jgi:cellobiose phosphorylase
MSSFVKADDRQTGETRSAHVRNAYGYFTPDGREFRITNPQTPRPWVNIISNPRVGLGVSQTGSGFTWIDNSQLAVITRWQQDLAHDCSGKFLYVRDAGSGDIWSLSPAPAWPQFGHYECQHGLGYTTFITEFAGIRAEWTLFVHATEPIELWRVLLENLTDQPRRLEVSAFLEWNCGVAPAPRREFNKLFIETQFDAQRGAILAANHMWEAPSGEFGHWNTSFPYTSALACTEPVLSALGDKATFLGRTGDLQSPAALAEDLWQPHFGRHEDPIAALRTLIELRPRQSAPLGFALVMNESRARVERALDKNLSVEAIDRALQNVKASWRQRLATHRVQTPETSLNFLTNDWLRYQAISARIWGRTGYYQQSGAYGFRDQLQDAQVSLTSEPQRCRDQIHLHAAHQFADGSVYHWWHPLTEQGLRTRMTDDLLWLAFVTADYIKETGDLSILRDPTPFVDDPKPQPLIEHVLRALRRVFERTSPRGLPYIGAGDWNDGLSACGLQERGESIWLGHFLAGLLADWAEILNREQAEGTEARRHEGTEEAETERRSDGPEATLCATVPGAAASHELAAEFAQRHEKLVRAINKHGWDGGWYLRATLDDGSKLGSAENRVGRIFLNAQTWAILSDVAPADRAARCMAAIREHLVTDAGPLLLAPAFDRPDERIGYITRYAPGLRENGGVYTHAATWAIAAACKMRDAELAGRLLGAINPALKDPERYWAEPYVLAGNVDGPDSPYFGRGGWTWYTGSAAWLHRVICEWVLGVRPDWDGLRIEPCLPPDWADARMTRPYRGCTYHIRIERAADLPEGVNAEVALNGRRLDNAVIPPPPAPGREFDVRVRCR